MTIDLEETQISSCPHVSIRSAPISPWGSTASFLVPLPILTPGLQLPLWRTLNPAQVTLSPDLHSLIFQLSHLLLKDC